MDKSTNKYNRRQWIALLIISLIIIAVFVVAYQYYVQSNNVEDQQYSEKRIIRFAYEVANQTSFAINNAAFSTYFPVTQLSNQRAESVKASRNYSEEFDVLGNHIGRFDMGLVPPFGKKQLNLTAVIETTDLPHKMSLKNKKRYLQSELFIETNHPKIVALAETLSADTDQDTLQNIYDWASTHIQYAGYVSEDKGALYALENKKGDCTEYAYSVVALARATGIAARAIGGYVYENNAVVAASDYHNWAEVYLDGRWRIIDAQNKVFMNKSQHYIAMRILSESELSLLGNSHRFLVAKEGLKVKLL